MEIVFEKKTEALGKLSLTLKPEDYLKELEKELRKVANKAHIKGFRPGKAPVNVIKSLYGDEILGEVVIKRFNDEVSRYIETNNIHLLGEPMLPKEYEFPRFNIRQPETYNFQVEIATVPPFELITEGYAAKKYTITLTQEEKKQLLENFLKDLSRVESKETVSTEKDFLFGRCEFIINQETQETTEQSLNFTTDALLPLEKLKPISRELFMNLKINDEVEIYPFQIFQDENESSKYVYINDKDLAEKLKDQKAKFKIERISCLVQPELNEAFFKEIYPNDNIRDEDTFKEKFLQETLQRIEAEANWFAKEQLKNEFIQKHPFELPIDFLKEWLKSRKNVSQQQIDLAENNPELFTQSLKWEILGNKLAQKFAVEVSKEEIKQSYVRDTKERIQRMLKIAQETEWITQFAEREFQKLSPSQIVTIHGQLAREKALEKLYESSAKIEINITKQDFEKELEEYSQKFSVGN